MFGTRKLGRTSDQRKAMLRQLTTDLLENGKLETTFCRAKEVQPVAEKMITLGKKATSPPTVRLWLHHEGRCRAQGLQGTRSEVCRPQWRLHESDPHRCSPRRRCRDGHHRAGVREYRSTAAECKIILQRFFYVRVSAINVRRCAQFFTRHIV